MPIEGSNGSWETHHTQATEILEKSLSSTVNVCTSRSLVAHSSSSTCGAWNQQPAEIEPFAARPPRSLADRTVCWAGREQKALQQLGCADLDPRDRFWLRLLTLLDHFAGPGHRPATRASGLLSK